MAAGPSSEAPCNLESCEHAAHGEFVVSLDDIICDGAAYTFGAQN